MVFFLGAHHLTSPPSQADSLLAMFDPLSSGEGNLLPQHCHGSQWKSPIKSMLMSQALWNSLSPVEEENQKKKTHSSSKLSRVPGVNVFVTINI